MSDENILTFEDAELLEEEILEQGGKLDETRPCGCCGNLTLALVSYKPVGVRKTHMATTCMFCDFMVRWPRMMVL